MAISKNFLLNLLYWGTGFPMLLLLWLTAGKHQELTLQNGFLFGFLGLVLVTRILIEKEKWETGTIKFSAKTIVLAFAAAGTLICFFSYYLF